MTVTVHDSGHVPLTEKISDRLPGAMPIVGVPVVVILALIVLAPVLESGYSGDDTWNSQTAFVLADRRQTFTDYWLNTVTNWMTNVGRFFPLALLQAQGVFLVFPARVLYKAYLIGMTIANLLLLLATVRAVARSWTIAILAGVIAVTTLQIRAWDDALVSYAGLQQAVVGCVLGTALSLAAFLRTESRGWLGLAVVLWTTSLLLYEMTYLLVLVPLLLCLTFPAERRCRLQAAATVIVPTAILGLFAVWLRLHAADQGGYVTNLAPERLIPTFWLQFAGAIPLSSVLMRPGSPLPPITITVTMVLVMVLTVACVVLVMLDLPDVSTRILGVLGGFGAIFWIIPAAIIAQTDRYQSVLVPGLAYIPVYVEYMGFALVAAATVLILARRVPLIGARLIYGLILGVGLGLVIQLTAVTNFAAVSELNMHRRWPRDLLAESIQRGIFAAVEDGSVLFAQRMFPETNRCFIQGVGGPRVDVLTPPSWFAVNGCARAIGGTDAPEPTLFLDVVYAPDGSAGRAILAKIDALIPVDQGYSASSSDLLVYVHGGRPFAELNSPVTCTWTPDPARLGDTSRVLKSSEIARFAEGPGWTLLRIRLTDGACAAESIPIPA